MYLGAKIQISEEKNKKNMSFFEREYHSRDCPLCATDYEGICLICRL